jgi:uncharacterized protein with ParB-like and HNH nuclease domain
MIEKYLFMETLFTPEYKVLNDFFGNDINYIIPAYQRPYSWESVGKSDKNNQVNVMWQDLIGYFEEKNPNPYFLGSMVLVGNSSSRTFEVIDGQQRLTTLVIFFVSIKCFLEKSKYKVDSARKDELENIIIEMISEIDRIIFNRRISGAIMVEKKVRIERSIGFDYDKVLNDVMECKDTLSSASEKITPEQKTVADRYFQNKNYIESKISERFLDNSVFTENSFTELNRFIEFLKNKVAIVRILASQFEVAYQIFEILNNRGLPLSNKDLLRNFLISEFHTLSQKEGYQHINAVEKWQKLEDEYILDNDFISRFVESTNAKNQRYSAFNDLKEIYENQMNAGIRSSRIEEFYKKIESDVKNYTNIISSDFDDEEIKNTILFLLNAGNITYTLNLLLAVFRKTTDPAKIRRFLKIYEKYITHILLIPTRRFAPTPIYEAIKQINKNDLELAQKEFLLNDVAREQLKTSIDNPIKDNDVAKLMIARYVWILADEANDDVIEQNLLFANSTLEHIIPQQPEENTNWIKDFSEDFRKEYIYKLGNMTLLTQRKNSANKNYDFEKKKEQYKKTKLSITTELTTDKFIMSEAFIKERHAKIVEKLNQYFNLENPDITKPGTSVE